MLIRIPVPIADAFAYADERALLPTDASSHEIRRQLSAEARRGAIYSARTTNAAYLQRIREVIEDLVNGKINEATARMLLRQALDDLGYTPEEGFGEESWEPVEEGTLRDLRSEARVQLVISTQVRMALYRGWIEQWRNEDRRWQAPAWELVRIEPRQVPRGQRMFGGVLIPDPSKGWPSRWRKAGGQFYGGRMIARVDDPVWSNLGKVEVDGLDNPFPPFAFNSGMGLMSINRTLAKQLGVISGDEIPGVPAGVAGPPSPPPPLPKLDPKIAKPLEGALEREQRKLDDMLAAELEAAGL